MTFTAYQEGAQETKTTVQDGGTQVFWEPADEIKVFFKSSIGRFVSQNSELAGVADFSGTLNILVGANEGFGGTNQIWGLYPYRADATYDGEYVTTTLPAEQTGRAGSFAKNTHICLARSGGNDLAFYNVTGGLRFSLTQDGIKSVTFEGNNGESLAGKIKLAFEGGIPAVKEVSEGETTLTLTAPGGGAFQTGQWYYIEAIPGTLSNGFKMVFSKGTETAKISSSGSVTISRGKYGSLADADEGLIFNENGGGNPDPSGVIQFADPIAKYACVEKFDTNGDGEVSYEEAAAATSLEGLFTNWNTVTRFDEIKFFTGATSTQGVFNGLSKLESMVIPDNITTIGSFQNCTSLKTVALPTGITSLPSNCFDGCSLLSEVTLPTVITSIPNYCFQGCSALNPIDLPATVVSIGQYSFSGCSALTKITVSENLMTIGSYAFQNCYSLSSFTFPTALTSIGQYAFYGCTALTSVEIGGRVNVGQYAFSGCWALTTASLGENVSFESYVFNDCVSLLSVDLPSSMTIIPTGLFLNCKNLSFVTWPSSLKTIEKSAFSGCEFKLADNMLALPSTVTSIGSRSFCGVRHLIVPSASPVSIASDSFVERYTFLYVPAGMVDMYKVRTNWSTFADYIYSIDSYPIILNQTIGEVVNLGLSVNWSSWNIGASSPEQHGNYYSWGETDDKWSYSWTKYKWCAGKNNTLTKYNTKSKYGYVVDNKTALDGEDDVATIKWGGLWRMPTKSEWTELKNNCTWTWTTQNGVNGYRVTSNKTGYTSKSIFIPAAGYDNGYSVGYCGCYWSSSLFTDHPDYAYHLYFISGEVLSDYYTGRNAGFSVRPVCPKE